MKKKRLNKGCACEGEETTPKHAEFISVDQVNRYMLQMTEEEQDTMSFRDVIAGILRTKPENIKSMKRSGLGWRVKAVGDMDDLENILDDNVDTLRRLKGAGEEEAEETDGERMHEHRVVYNEEAGLVTIYLDGKVQGEQELLGDYPETEIWKALMEYFPEEDKDELQTIADEVYYNGSHIWYT